MTIAQIVERFSVDGLHKKAAVFDYAKLEWMNGQHLAASPIEDIEAIVYPAFERAGLTTVGELHAQRDWYRGLLELLRVRARTVDEIVPMAVPYFRDDVEYDPSAVAKQWKDPVATSAILLAVRDTLHTFASWDVGTMETGLRELADKIGTTSGKIFQPLRVALTGQVASPGIFDVLLYVGRERAIARLTAAVAFLGKR
jgi:glutamyl-tRNA synthetase